MHISKSIIISLFLFFTVNAQDGVSRFFLDKNSPASLANQDGLSWATAWSTTGTNANDRVGSGEIDWSVIGSGDTLFISGGTDSCVYLPYYEGQPHYFNQGGTLRDYATQVVICPAFVAGRTDGDWATKNGRVVLSDTVDNTFQAVVVFGGYLNNVKLYGVTIKDGRALGSDYSLSLFVAMGYDIVLESDTLLTSGQGGGGGFGFGARGVLRNCVYIEPPNENTTASDFMGQWQGKGGLIIEGNKIFLENNYTMIENTTGTGVTFTDTSMTDATLTGGLAMIPDYHQWTLIIVPFGEGQNDYQYMSIFSNDTNTFYGHDPDLYGWHSPIATGQGATSTTTSTSLTDSYGGNTVNEFVGWIMTCAGSTMIITSNTSDTYYGTGWTGGTPASGNNYTIENRQRPANGSAWYMEGVHRDIIQYSYLDSAVRGENYENIIRNNLIVDDGVKGTGWNSMIYTSDPGTDIRFLFYNNIFVNREEISSGGIFLYTSTSDEERDMSIRAFNNTMITKGDGAWNAVDGYTSTVPFSLENFDTIYVKNNIVIVDTTHKTFINLNRGYINGSAFYWDNNIYASDGYNPESFTYDGSVRTWDNWVAQGFDTNSDTMQATNITFANKYGREYTDYLTETGRDLGDDLTDMPDYVGILARHPDIIKDILGNDRVVPFDIGALEFDEGAVDTVPSFSFTALNNQEINTAYIGSATFTFADSTFSVWTTTGARFNINSSSSLSTTLKTAVSGDAVYVETVTGSSYSTGYTETIVAGGVSRDFTVTTESEPYIPPSGSGGWLKQPNGTGIITSDGKRLITR